MSRIPTVDEADLLEQAAAVVHQLGELAAGPTVVRSQPVAVVSAPPELAASTVLQGAYEHGLMLAGQPVRSYAQRQADAAEIRTAGEARSALVRQHAAELAAAYGTAQQLRSFR